MRRWFATLLSKRSSPPEAPRPVESPPAPGEADRHIRQALDHQERGELRAALAELSRALAIEPHNDEAHYYRGDIHSQLGELDKALADFARALSLAPSNAAVIRIAMGNAYGRNGKYDEALTSYSRALAIDPENAVALYDRGVTYDRLEKYDQALADFALALVLAPWRAAEIHFAMGNTYGRKGKYDDALASYAESLRLAPSNPDAYCGRAVVFGLNGDYAAAVEECTAALHYDSEHVRAYELRSIAYENVRDFARARADQERAAELQSRRAERRGP